MPERIIIDSTLAPTTPRMRTHSMQHSSPRGFGVCGSLPPGCKQLTIARVFTVGYNIKRPAGADSWPFRPWNGWRGLKDLAATPTTEDWAPARTFLAI